MRSGILKITTLFCLFFLINNRAILAQQVKKLGLENGLSQSSVYSMLQDSFGFLWVGTADGLNRYDGHQFKTYRFSEELNSSGISNFISGPMVEDSLHHIWFGGSFGIGRWNFFSNKLEIIPFKTRNGFKQAMLLKVSASEVWFNCGYDLVCLNPSNGETTYYPIPDLIRQFDFYSGFKVDLAGDIWMNTHYGLSCFHLNTRKFESVQLPKPYVVPDNFLYLLHADRLGNKWLNSKNGIMKLDGKTNQYTLIFPHLANQVIYGFTIIGKQIVVGIQGSGIQFYDLQTKRLTRELKAGSGENQLSNQIITLFYADKSENLWIGLDGFGLNYISLAKPKFDLFNNTTYPNWPVNSNFIKTFYQQGDTLFFGTHEHGLRALLLSKKLFIKIELPLKAGKIITGIFKKDQHELWISTINDVFVYNLKTKVAKEIPFEVSKNIRSGNVGIVSIYPFKSGAVLASTFYGNYYYPGKPGQKFRAIASHNTYCAFTHLDHSGMVWVSSIRDGSISRYQYKNNELKYVDYLLHQSNVRSFYEDTLSHHLWMASEKGLIDYDLKSRQYKFISRKEGFSDNYLYAVLPGVNDELWMSSNHGLICYHTRSGKLENYDVSYGLQSNEFNTGSFYRNEQGELYFGGINGFNRFNPKEISKNRHTPIVCLTRMSLSDVPIPDSINPMAIRLLKLPYNQNTFTFGFSAIELNQPDKVVVKYKLVGIDKNWILDMGNHTARYPNLPPGEYVLLAKAGNSDGIWSKETELIRLKIQKPWWLKWQVILLEMVFIIYFIWLAIKLFVRFQLKEKQRELDKIKSIQEERERISKDMHDDLGSGLTKISILSELLRKNIAEDFRNQQLEKISETAGELVDNMSNLVWTLNPGNDSLQNLLSYLREYIHNNFDSSATQVEVFFQEDVPDYIIPPHIRKNIFLTIKETCNNTAKYAHATNIRLSFYCRDKRASFIIEDNGIGFDPDRTRAFGNGLINMQKRMEEIGGKFEIFSKPGSGTKTVLDFEIRH